MLRVRQRRCKRRSRGRRSRRARRHAGPACARCRKSRCAPRACSPRWRCWPTCSAPALYIAGERGDIYDSVQALDAAVAPREGAGAGRGGGQRRAGRRQRGQQRGAARARTADRAARCTWRAARKLFARAGRVRPGLCAAAARHRAQLRRRCRPRRCAPAGSTCARRWARRRRAGDPPPQPGRAARRS
ncbi:MAG: hypothetical protein MZV63_26880 [Marinilabiliales bacterium]|nr:hypothetical protein [Marinilabiliales bacterium]